MMESSNACQMLLLPVGIDVISKNACIAFHFWQKRNFQMNMYRSVSASVLLSHFSSSSRSTMSATWLRSASVLLAS